MLPNNMGMKKVAVTGGAGFIGSHLVDRLISLGVEVVVLDNLSTGKRENVNPKANLVICNIPNSTTDFLCEQTKDVDVIFHLAAKTAVQESIENPEMYNEINVGGTLKMLEICRLNNIPKFIFSSTSAIYGNTKTPTSETNPVNPISPYATTKLIGEKYCKLYNKIYGIDTVCLRYFNVYGNRMNNEGGYKLVMPIFKDQILNNKPLTINNDGEQRRDFVHVEDIVEANILAATRKEDFNGDVFNIGNGKNYSINEVADMFKGKKIYGEKRIEPFETLADNAKAKLNLGWKPKGDLKKWIINYKKELGI